MRMTLQEILVELPQMRVGRVEEHQVQVAAVDGDGGGEVLQHLRLHADVAAELGLHLLELGAVDCQAEAGIAAEGQLDDLQQVARAAHHDVVRFAAGLVRLARLQGERLRLTALGAAEQLDALAPDRVDIAVDRRGIEAVAIDQPALAVAQPERERQAVEDGAQRSEEHTSELQSLMRSSYAVFCLQKKKKY